MTYFMYGSKGQSDVVKILIENGADIMQLDNYLLTPLHHAALGGHADTVKLILKQLIDFIIRKKPLIRAASNGKY